MRDEKEYVNIDPVALRAALDRALKILTPKERRCLICRFYEGMSPEDISENYYKVEKIALSKIRKSTHFKRLSYFRFKHASLNLLQAAQAEESWWETQKERIRRRRTEEKEIRNALKNIYTEEWISREVEAAHQRQSLIDEEKEIQRIIAQERKSVAEKRKEELKKLEETLAAREQMWRKVFAEQQQISLEFYERYYTSLLKPTHTAYDDWYMKNVGQSIDEAIRECQERTNTEPKQETK